MVLTTLAPGEVGTIVTYLEMRKRPPLRPLPESPFRLQRWEAVDPARYRLLFPKGTQAERFHRRMKHPRTPQSKVRFLL